TANTTIDLPVSLLRSHHLLLHSLLSFLSIIPPPPRPTLFPYTTLFRSAKTKHREKRGGDAVKLSLDDVINLSQERADDLLALDDALDELARVDERKSRVVELRYFGGFSVEETAQILEVSPDTVMRDWKMAKAWLYQQIKAQGLRIGERPDDP